MANANYVVNRDNIYVGRVMQLHTILFNNGESKSIPLGAPLSSMSKHLRSILFVPGAQEIFTDLLYQSPSYPILDEEFITDAIGDTFKVGTIYVDDCYCLAPLLQEFRYPEQITLAEATHIRKTFFNGKFTTRHRELFGFREEQLYDYHLSGLSEKEINQIKRKLFLKRLLGKQRYIDTEHSTLSKGLYEILMEHGDGPIAHEYYDKKDSFVPDKKEEGPILKLVSHNKRS